MVHLVRPPSAACAPFLTYIIPNNLMLLGFFLFIWTFAKELWAEKCGKACRAKGCGKEKKGGGGVEMVGSWTANI